MRNDFYQGMFEDRYLAHTDMGAGARRFHKYLYREWRNGKWRYYYSKLNQDVLAARKQFESPFKKHRQKNNGDLGTRLLVDASKRASVWVVNHTVGKKKKG